MAGSALTRFAAGLWPVALLAGLLMASLQLMSQATENTETFGRIYSWLVLLNLVGLAALTVIIGVNIMGLLRQLRGRVAGSRLAARMVVIFVILALTPVSLVYYFSLRFLHRGIDSWFDVRIEQGLADALELSQAALDLRMRELLRQTQQMASELEGVPNELMALRLNDLRERSSADELTVLSHQGRVIASSTLASTSILPHRPDDASILQLRQAGYVAMLDPIPDVGLHARLLVAIPDLAPSGEQRALQGLFRLPERVSRLADTVQASYAQYQEVAYLRNPLKRSFDLTLSLALLLSVLSAVWAAFYSARRLAAPIRDLAEGTRAVATGDYAKQLPESGSDELGFLVQSFNEMTRKLDQARDQARQSQEEVEEQRTYLEAVLARLSSGVITLDEQRRLFTANQAASHILGIDLGEHTGQDLTQLAELHPHLAGWVDAVDRRVAAGSQDWREEVSLFGTAGRQVLLCRGTPLLRLDEHVIVFDDVTALIQAQRDAAWSEVARRLAHEIKNPLTPIQLSAERLRHKYLDKMKDADRETLDRLTHTIVQQVESMKEMVNAFSNYARSPQLHPKPMDANALVREVAELYRYPRKGAGLHLNLEDALPTLEADPGRLRQVLHNLIKNAFEACEGRESCQITVSTRADEGGKHGHVDVVVEDDGPGFPAEVRSHLFEPYVTTKKKGTGLGLAIVKKIVEEHGGTVYADNRAEGGARIVLRLPSLPSHGHPAAQSA